MEKLKFLILGAGPAGISFARALQLSGEKSFRVIEQEPRPGGLCRSTLTPYSLADVGGGHMWCTKFPEADDFVKKHLPESEWLTFERNSTAILMGNEIPYPIEENLWRLPPDLAEEIILDVLQARLRTSSPANFGEFIRDKFGDILAGNYMIPYNSKLWGSPLSRMSLSWTHKIPPTEPSQVLRSVIRREGNKENLFHRRWQYPQKGGFQSIFDAIAKPLEDEGHLIYGEQITKIEVGDNVVNGRFKADTIVTTIPWTSFSSSSNAPDDIKLMMDGLESTSLVVSLVHADPNPSGPQWTYYPDLKLPHHRRFFSSRWMPGASFDFFETNASRFSHEPGYLWSFYSKHAYPVPTIQGDGFMGGITSWCRGNGIIPIGRWGKHEYINSDVCIFLALWAASTVLDRTPGELLAMA